MRRVKTGVLARRAPCSCFPMPSARLCSTAGLQGAHGRVTSPTHGLTAIRSWRSRSLLCRACLRRHRGCTRGLATLPSLGLGPRGEPSRRGRRSFSFSARHRAAVLVLSTRSTVSRGTVSGRLGPSSASPSEPEGRASAERGHPPPLRLALGVSEGAWARPASSPGATSEPSGGLGEALRWPGQAPGPTPHGTLALCLVGTHRSMSGTGCCADGGAGPSARASGAPSGSTSSLLLELLLEPPLSPLSSLSSLLELQHTLRRGRRRRLPRLCCFLAMIFHLLRHWESVRCGSSEAIFAQ